MEPSVVRLRALAGTPLADASVRGMVVATAHAIAERTGARIRAIDASNDAVTVAIEVDKLAAMGFLAELRRVTGAWYARKHPGRELWGAAE